MFTRSTHVIKIGSLEILLETLFAEVDIAQIGLRRRSFALCAGVAAARPKRRSRYEAAGGVVKCAGALRI